MVLGFLSFPSLRFAVDSVPENSTLLFFETKGAGKRISAAFPVVLRSAACHSKKQNKQYSPDFSADFSQYSHFLYPSLNGANGCQKYSGFQVQRGRHSLKERTLEV